jgi:hypothetical protein
MNDFEVHPRGSFTEVKLSRELVNAIEQVTQQYGSGIIPTPVLKAYLELKNHYAIQVETELL